MLYTNKPEVFDPKFDVVSCFVEYKGKILLLHRQDHKPQGNTYGVPAGKVDAGEDIWTTVRREIEEET
jgi:ADP-ribose pyrophosphatase YjhB (NUDIX family)